MLRVGDIVTTTVGLPHGANPDFMVYRIVRTESGDIKYALHNYHGRRFLEEELTLVDKYNAGRSQFTVGDRVVNIETDTIETIETVTRTDKGDVYTLENSLKFKRDSDLRPANYTLF